MTGLLPSYNLIATVEFHSPDNGNAPFPTATFKFTFTTEQILIAEEIVVRTIYEILGEEKAKQVASIQFTYQDFKPSDPDKNLLPV